MEPHTQRTYSFMTFLAVTLAATSAYADPVFRGPKIHDGAWTVSNDWGDPAAGPGDTSQGSFAWQYRLWSKERTDTYVEDRTKLDCADLSIALLCEYAAINNLPLSWRVYYPAERRFITFDNTDKQFESPEHFQEWSQWFLGAMNLADNTYAIDYETWAGGDMVLMDWNKTEEWPNFGDREVWHTYLIGVPDEVIYYGNEDDNLQPTPVTRVTSGSRMQMVHDHPDIHEDSPRRFRLFRGNVWSPVAEQAEVIRVSTSLNLRAGPGTDQDKIGSALRGEVFTVVGRDGVWRELLRADGSRAWAHGYFLRVTPVAPEGTATGLAGALALGS
jgi:hypothetical protein